MDLGQAVEASDEARLQRDPVRVASAEPVGSVQARPPTHQRRAATRVACLVTPAQPAATQVARHEALVPATVPVAALAEALHTPAAASEAAHRILAVEALAEVDPVGAATAAAEVIAAAATITTS